MTGLPESWRGRGKADLREVYDQIAAVAGADADPYSQGVVASLRWLVGLTPTAPVTRLDLPVEPGRCLAELHRALKEEPSPYRDGVVAGLSWGLDHGELSEELANGVARPVVPPHLRRGGSGAPTPPATPPPSLICG
jgi:hypothetical protein